jgi:hypothetical protein
MSPCNDSPVDWAPGSCGSRFLAGVFVGAALRFGDFVLDFLFLDGLFGLSSIEPPIAFVT